VDRLLRSATGKGAGRDGGAKILRLINEGAGARELAPVVAEHAVAHAQLHALSTSGLLGDSRRRARMSDVIAMAGVEVVRSVAVHWVCGLLDGSRASLPPGYWEHVVRTAAAGVVIGDAATISRASVVSSAMVHDVGRALLLRSDPAKYRRLEKDVADEAEVVAAERRTYGCDHTDIGAGLIEHFGAPEAIVTAVLRHHEDPEGRPDLSSVLWLADRVAAVVGGATSVDLEWAFVRSRLGYLRIDDVVDSTREGVDAAHEFLVVA
jgi:HD-like signal output (HDOD) protein